jgi:hypothetical protein
LSRHRRRSSFARQNLETPAPVPRLPSHRLWLVPLVTGIMAVSYFGVKNYRSILPGPSRSSQAILAAQEAVKHSFSVGTAIHFMPRELTRLEPSAGGFTIAGSVEAVSADGRISQVYDYSCTVTTNLIGNWSVTNLDLEPRDNSG